MKVNSTPGVTGFECSADVTTSYSDAEVCSEKLSQLRKINMNSPLESNSLRIHHSVQQRSNSGVNS